VRPTLERTFQYSTNSLTQHSRSYWKQIEPTYVLSLRTLNIRHWRHTWRVLWLFHLSMNSSIGVRPDTHQTPAAEPSVFINVRVRGKALGTYSNVQRL